VDFVKAGAIEKKFRVEKKGRRVQWQAEAGFAGEQGPCLGFKLWRQSLYSVRHTVAILFLFENNCPNID
jgi:hypothetical protein